MASPTLHALPGMGGTHAMYSEPWGELPGFLAHDWMHHRGEHTLEAVAASACDAFSIQDGDSLVGSSLGGMVACEFIRHRLSA